MPVMKENTYKRPTTFYDMHYFLLYPPLLNEMENVDHVV